MKPQHIITTALSCLPLICAAQETAQQDIIPYVSRLSVYADDAYLELTIGSVAQNKLYLCDVEDLVIRDSKGNVLTGNHVSYSDSYIDEFIPDNSTSVDLHILDRIKGARVSVSGTLVMESVPVQKLATVYIPVQLDKPAKHRVGEQELYICGDNRLPQSKDTPLYNSISITAKSDTSSRIQRFRWWKKGSSAADVAEEFTCDLISAKYSRNTRENTLATETPVNTCTLEVTYWPKGEIVRIPFHFNISLNKAEPVQP